MFCALTVCCQRSACDEEETVELDQGAMREALGQHLPEGWGWDYVGLDTVLHCPAHRGKVAA